MRGRGKFVVLCINDGDKEQSLQLEEVLLVAFVVVEEVERWCHCWCVCCHHLSLLLDRLTLGFMGRSWDCGHQQLLCLPFPGISRM
eukprot:2904432-Ditylum_brightwellii.AAC.1